jgi:histidinol-phosphatase
VEAAAALDLALDLARRADAITMARFRARDLVVDTKPDLTPVSEADRAVEEMVRAELAVRAPRHGVLGEEFGSDGDDLEWRWVVDPIDGTKNYVRGVPVWATLLGLEHRGEPVLGVVSAPALGTRWWGGAGIGAFRDGEPIRVSHVGALADAHVSFAWDTNDASAADHVGERLQELRDGAWRTRGIGDFWQHMLVADGSFDVAVDPVVAYWDIAALLPILVEAGGRWSTTRGDRDARTATSLVCTNGRLHADVLRVLGG